jgi:hypothetical protein
MANGSWISEVPRPAPLSRIQYFVRSDSMQMRKGQQLTVHGQGLVERDMHVACRPCGVWMSCPKPKRERQSP